MTRRKTYHTSFLTIQKRDDAQQIIEGYASSEDIDMQSGVWPPTDKNGRRPEGQVFYEGDIVETQALKKALPDYMEWANIHEMHKDDKAVGTILKAEVIEGKVTLPDGRILTNPLRVVAHIVDPLAWQKVITGVYKGLSIFGEVYKLELAKVAGRVVRLIKSFRMTEISLVDRPANPGARILLWKGANMKKPQDIVSKAGDPQKAVELLQELRNQCELDGDLAAAGNYTNAIALIMQGQGAEVEVVAEADEESQEEHAELGKPAPGEGEEAVPDGETKEEPTPDELDKALNEEKPDETPPEEKEDTVKKSMAVKSAPEVLDVISKAEFTGLMTRVDEISKAFSGDIARIVKSLEELSEQVDSLQVRPVLHELPAGGINDQPVQILKGMLNEMTDPGAREALGLKIAEMEILAAKPNYVGYSR